MTSTLGYLAVGGALLLSLADIMLLILVVKV